MAGEQSPIPVEQIERAILLIRGQKIMLDADLAGLYGVTVGRLNEAVKRNRDRFPADFMFQLSDTEFANLKSQIAISSYGWGGRRHPPYAFTEQGVAMLSSVLKSKRAVHVNIAIMRAFGNFARCCRPTRSFARSWRNWSANWKAMTGRFGRCLKPSAGSWHRRPNRNASASTPEPPEPYPVATSWPAASPASHPPSCNRR